MKVLDSDPKQLASLIGDDDIGERIWRPDELAAILQHQLTTPLHVDLAGVGGAAGQLRELAGARGLVLKSFGDLLQHPQPPVGLLKLMKDFAKACGHSPQSTIPKEVSSVIYFASILAAMTRCSRRITRLDNAALLKAVLWALKQPWLDEITRGIFLEGQHFLTGASDGSRRRRESAQIGTQGSGTGEKCAPTDVGGYEAEKSGPPGAAQPGEPKAA